MVFLFALNHHQARARLSPFVMSWTASPAPWTNASWSSTENVTGASEGGAPAFLGSVYYVADPKTGAPLPGWPPDIAASPAKSLKEAPSSPTRQRHRRRGWGFGGASPRLGDAFGGGSGSAQSDTASKTPYAAVVDHAAATRLDDEDAAAAKKEGASAYFTSRHLARKWRDFIRRPKGLSKFHRRRLWRPSDIPRAPVDVASCPMGEAYDRLCVGWGNPVLAAQLGFVAGVERERDSLPSIIFLFPFLFFKSRHT